uniref:Uncharacterized protein n=1 Tax=Rhizophora mucronata TaxID=61149 RepID=A0A2P2PI10_RHIMU
MLQREGESMVFRISGANSLIYVLLKLIFIWMEKSL